MNELKNELMALLIVLGITASFLLVLYILSLMLAQAAAQYLRDTEDEPLPMLKPRDMTGHIVLSQSEIRELSMNYKLMSKG